VEKSPDYMNKMNHTESTQHEADMASRPESPQAFIALGSRPFRWLLAGHMTFFLAMQGLILTRSILAWELTGSELSLAYINMAVAIPMVFGAFIGGAVTDRVERRQLVIIGQMLILLNESIILLLLFFNKLEFWHMLGTAFIVGCIFPFVMPARMAIVYNVVGKALLPNAMALTAGGMNLARVLGPAMAGLLIHFITIKGAYFFSVMLYAVSSACMLKLPACYPEGREEKPLFADMVYGFKYVLGHRQILVCLIFGMLPMLLAMPTQNLLVVFSSDQVWDVGERGLGMMMSVMGIGGLVGALWVARMPHNVNRVKLMFITALAFAVFLAGFSLTPWFYLALLPLLVANIFANASQTLNNTALQLLVDDSVRGRMSSFIMMSFGLTPLGVLPIAYLSEQIGAPWAVFTACFLLFVLVTGFYLFSPTLRSLDADILKHAKEE